MAVNVHIICCDHPPDVTPPSCGTHWIDTNARITYISVGTSSVDDWQQQDERLIKVMNCDASLATDDLVYQSDTTNNLAVKSVNNTNLQPVVGHVIHKPSSTTCVVQLKGVVDFTVPKGRLFLSPTGTYTTTIPTGSGQYIQSLGWSCGDGRVEINPELRRTRRS